MKSKFGAASTKKKGKKNDLALLEDALVGDAEKKVRHGNQKKLKVDIASLAFVYQQSRYYYVLKHLLSIMSPDKFWAQSLSCYLSD